MTEACQWFIDHEPVDFDAAMGVARDVAEGRRGPTSIRMAAISGVAAELNAAREALKMRVSIGKLKNTRPTFGELLERDPGYVQWLAGLPGGSSPTMVRLSGMARLIWQHREQLMRTARSSEA